MKWMVFDTETTGFPKPSSAVLEEQPRIIEIALVEILDGAVVAEHEWLVNPQRPITEEITKITGIKDSDVKDAPNFAALYPELAQTFLGVGGMTAHNLPFDMGMLTIELRRIGKEYAFPYPPRQLCSVQETIHTKGRRMKLTELYELVMGKPLEQKHRALSDARALTEIILKEGWLAA